MALFKPTVVAAELPPALRFHDLRHTCASAMINQGVIVKAIAEPLGHSTVSMTLNHHARLFDIAGRVDHRELGEGLPEGDGGLSQ